MLHNHGNVLSSQTVLREGCAIVNFLSLILGSRLGLTSGLVGELLGLLLLETSVAVLKLEFSENREGLSALGASENFGIVDNKDGAVSLSEGNTGDTCEWLHAKLKECLSALLFTSVVGFVLSLVLEFWHFPLLVLVVMVMVVTFVIVSFVIVGHFFLLIFRLIVLIMFFK